MASHAEAAAPRLVEADGPLARRVYAESHALWGSGLSLDAYAALWEELARSPWGRERFRLLVFTDDGRRVLSSLKRYRPEIRWRGRVSPALGIGAVFTPFPLRGRGHAVSMLEAALEEAEARGDAFALLFSDIGEAFYERLGFHSLPAFEARGTLRAAAAPKEPIRLRPLREDDLDDVRAAHDAASGVRSLAVVRDPALWRFVLERSASFFERLDGSGIERRFQVAESEGRFRGYLVSVDGGGTWELREVAAAGGEAGLAGVIARAGAAEARARGLQSVQGWIPRSLADAVPEWRLRFSPRRSAIPMVRPLAGDAPEPGPSAAEDLFIPYLDQF